MDYFRIFNLTREPFSNSPEPEFFFPSAKHLSCLQQLEMSIRLRRGLNVVIGDVGAGKTTLCRELILKFTESEQDRREMQTHLLLDPAFSSPREFLSTVALTFGLPSPGSDESEWQLKESIKNDLLRKGVEEKKIVVLIIDEGQKLPEFCLEILREFLNYETNKNKLLQIVIFAQNEFQELLKARPNFADRINLLYDLKPLNFLEMKAMIRFRLTRAGQPADDPHAFSLPALWAIYRATGGYPRKVVTLCHQVILALIIKNQKTAGWSLVRSCAERTPVHQIARFKQKPVRWAAASAVAVLLALFITGVIAPDRMDPVSFFKKLSFNENKQAGTTASVSIASVQPLYQRSQDVAGTPVKDVEAPGGKMPKLLGKITVHQRDTIYWVFRRVYEDFNLTERQIQEVRDANPHIKNLDIIRAGEMVNIPAIPVMSNPLPTGEGHFRVQIARSSNLDEAHKILVNHPDGLPPVRLFSYWNGREGAVFTVLLKRDFADEASARDAIKRLPPSIAANASVMNDWDKDTIFFAFR
jgi:general secretion pathway protein A